jgi:hypothetical protein
MSTYYYYANKTKKEFLDCPAKCGLKFYSYLNGNHCSKKLLPHLLSGRWKGDNIYMYSEHDDWNLLADYSIDPEWKDITQETIVEFNEDYKEFNLEKNEWEFDPQNFITCKPREISDAKED